MGGYGGPYGMGPGMMGGYGWGGYDALDLTDEQRDKIAEIQKDVASKRWGLMSAMHELRWSSFGPGAKDTDPRKTYDAMAALRKQMFETALDADKRIEAVLTKEQKDQLRKERRRGW
jgi:Spy/CpxP family protein refolding chaperone